MQSILVRAGVAVVLIAVAIVLFIVLSDDDGNGGEQAAQPQAPPTAAPQPPGEQPASPQAPSATPPQPGQQVEFPTIEIRDAEPVGGVRELTVQSGDHVRFRVLSDTPGEIHVHGYELQTTILAGGEARFDIPADLEGSFEVELHHGGEETQIADLRVEP